MAAKWKDTEPVRTFLYPVVLLALVACGQAFLAGQGTRGIVSAGIAALIAAGTEAARRVAYAPETVKRMRLVKAAKAHKPVMARQRDLP